MKSKQLNHVKGNCHEQLAVEYLKKQGFHVIDCNFTSRHGEIDIIGQHGDYLVFVEVKYRHNQSYGLPMEAVSFAKQKQICQTCRFYCYTHGISEATPIRFDVISILDKQITWIPNAFSYCLS